MPLTINGTNLEFAGDPRTTLLDFLRDHCALTGTKNGCDHGQCGACTVLVNGRRINSCLTLAVMHEGDAITTIEGIGTADALHPLQKAFVRHDGYQCGYCTPGQICSAKAMLDEASRGWPSFVSDNLAEPAALTREEIRERMSYGDFGGKSPLQCREEMHIFRLFRCPAVREVTEMSFLTF